MNSENLLKNFDLCVIGSGPAGIITVLEYTRLNPGKEVLLIEYGYPGQKEKNSLDDSIKVGNQVNHHNPYECTNKGLGGTSLTWGGRCVMYDDIDFIKRPTVVENCTWDIQLFDEVKNYTPTAAVYFECGEPLFSLSAIPEFEKKRIAENFKEDVVIDSAVERWSMPTRFGKRYEKELAARQNLTLVQGYEAREFTAPDENGIVKNVFDNTLVEIKSKNFVIAAGTQETTRILLRNKQLFKLLNYIPPALGRYYQCHIFGKIASVIFNGNPQKTDYGFLRNKDGTYMRRRFQFSTKYLVDNDLLNTAIWLDNPLYFDPKHKNGAMSFMYLAMITPFLGKKLAPPAIAYSITKGESKKIYQPIYNVIKDLPGSIIKPAMIIFKRYWLKRKLPGIFFI